MDNHEVVESNLLRMECGSKGSKVDRTLKGFNSFGVVVLLFSEAAGCAVGNKHLTPSGSFSAILIYPLRGCGRFTCPALTCP